MITHDVPNHTQFLKILGARCREVRKSRGLSQKVAAQRAGIDYRHYQNVEGGKVNMRIDTMLNLMGFYNLSLGIFVTPEEVQS